MHLQLGSGVNWLWSSSESTDPIWPLARELSYVTGVAIKRRRKKKKEFGNVEITKLFTVQREVEILNNTKGHK